MPFLPPSCHFHPALSTDSLAWSSDAPCPTVMVIHYKMYLAAPVSGKADRFPFVFSRADTHHTLYAMYGEHGEELLEGVEDGMVGMKARAGVACMCGAPATCVTP